MPDMKHKEPSFEILVIEDSPSDAFILKEAFKHAKHVKQVHVVHDGVEALAFLRKEGRYATAPRPHIIFLDLNTPRKDGREVLAEIKTDEQLLSIPVIVLTSSSADQDVSNAYSLHANCYVTKPADFSQIKQVIKAIESFWFTHVTIPTHA
jgi:two-component system, chemotaxis family, response regulator Rcp1